MRINNAKSSGKQPFKNKDSIEVILNILSNIAINEYRKRPKWL